MYMSNSVLLLALWLMPLAASAQERVMNIHRRSGSVSRTRVADVRQISFLGGADTTMYMQLASGARLRTPVGDVGEITFADTTYNLTSQGLRILEAADLCWPDDRLLPHLMPPATLVRSLDMNAARLSSEERLMFCVMQGIVNRSRPRLLLYNHNEEPQATWPDAHSLRTVGTSASAPYTLVRQFREEIRGLVLYSTARSEHYANLAATVAGLERLLPVTEEVRARLAAAGMDLPVMVDLSGLEMTNALGVYRYLYDNYWARCNHRLLISERPLIPYVHDIGAACGSACLWLDPRNAAERQLLDRFLHDLTPGRDIVLGWYPEERSGIGEATRYGLSTVPADFFENASIYSAVSRPVKVPPVPKRQRLQNRVYAAVYISDGDNIQYCQHAMAKIFEQGARGQMALNWTVSPALADLAPMMLNHYYGRATANDCFVCGPSGLGYAMPYDAHNQVYYASANQSRLLAPYTRLTGRYLERSGLRVITVWDDLSTIQRMAYLQNCPYLYGLTVNDWERQAGRLTAKVVGQQLPVVPLYPCYANGPDVIADFFQRDIRNYKGTAPMFVTGQATVWDAGPDRLAVLRERLDALSPGNVSIVRADHWFSLYNEAHRLPFNLTVLQQMEVTSSPARTSVKYAANGSPSEAYQWVSKEAADTAWVMLDFQEPFSLSRFVVRHAEAGGLEPWLNNRDFRVECSLDGAEWHALASCQGNAEPVTDVSFPPVDARYVRLTVTRGGADHYVRIADIEVWGAVERL